MNDDDILDYIEDSRNLRATGMELEFDYDENDMLVMKPYSEMSTLESISIGLEKVGSAVTGVAAGVGSATAGFIPDLTVALPVAVKDALSAEDGKKLKAFGETFERLSKENFGVEFYRGIFNNAIDSLDLDDQLKEDAKAGFNLGEFFDVLGPAYGAIKKGPQIVRGVKDKMQQVGKSAQKRLDEDQGSVAVSSMGVGEMGKVVDKGLSKLAPTDLRISGRFPTAVKPEADPIENKLDIGLTEVKLNKKIFENNINLIKDYPNLRKDEIKKSVDEVSETYINHLKDNLLWLYDKVPEQTRQRSKLWYDGANKVTKNWAKEFDTNEQSVAAVIAALSPQKDWYMNASLGYRVLDIMKNKKDIMFDNTMKVKAKTIIPQRYSKQLTNILNKKLSDLDSSLEKSIWLRIYDEAYNDRSYRTLTPEGNFANFVKTDKGENAKTAWNSLNMISKAIDAYESGGDVKVISKLMGNKHKVRNFYNNIIDPNSAAGDVTIDTHAVAAATLRPLSGNSTPVHHNFGTSPEIKKKPKDFKGAMKNSAITGVQGSYGIYVDAYRKAAKERGILPREMQSITWEAVRGLFPSTYKQKQNIEDIDNLWYQYRNNKLNLDEVRNEIERKAGGINPPEWE